jgi:hypothetical protein
MGTLGAELLADGMGVLTHCNAGALATVGIGTALAPLYVAARAGKRLRVFADETRPLLQGARLTAWELARGGLDVTVLVDGAAGQVFQRGWVQAVLVGADRIARNGDVANKIGTYPLAVLAPRPALSGRRLDPDRGARRQRGHASAGRLGRARGRARLQSGLRRDAGRARERARVRAGRRARAGRGAAAGPLRDARTVRPRP